MIYRIKVFTSGDAIWSSASVYICGWVAGSSFGHYAKKAYARSTSICEMDVAIIVGSMPAFYAFFKGKAFGASWLASMNTLVLRPLKAASRGNVVSSPERTAGVSSSLVVSGRHDAGENGYLEIHDTRSLGNYELESVKTENPDEAVAPGTLEAGKHSPWSRDPPLDESRRKEFLGIGTRNLHDLWHTQWMLGRQCPHWTKLLKKVKLGSS